MPMRGLPTQVPDVLATVSLAPPTMYWHMVRMSLHLGSLLHFRHHQDDEHMRVLVLEKLDFIASVGTESCMMLCPIKHFR